MTIGINVQRNRRLLRRKGEIELLDAESINIFPLLSLHTHYPNRPIEIEQKLKILFLFETDATLIC